MTAREIKMIEDEGWIIECESPLEIRSIENPECRANLFAARIVIDYVMQIVRARSHREAEMSRRASR